MTSGRFTSEAVVFSRENPEIELVAGDAVMASAALDRLLHRATFLNVRGDSYRMKDARRAGTGERNDATNAEPERSRQTQAQSKRSKHVSTNGKEASA